MIAQSLNAAINISIKTLTIWTAGVVVLIASSHDMYNIDMLINTSECIHKHTHAFAVYFIMLLSTSQTHIRLHSIIRS